MVKPDIIAGAVLALMGLFVAAYASMSYQMGTISSMGPGFFPTAIGALLCMLGIAIAIAGMAGGEGRADFNLRPFLLIAAGIAAFAATIDRFGLVVAVPLLIMLTSRSSNETRWRTTIILSVLMTVVAILVFVVGLGVQVRIANWPS